jgi:PAS domain S-box-containing protein
MQVLLDSVPAFIWYKDRQNRILRANRLAAESMGMSVEQLEGLDLGSIPTRRRSIIKTTSR